MKNVLAALAVALALAGCASVTGPAGKGCFVTYPDGSQGYVNQTDEGCNNPSKQTSGVSQ